MKNLKEDILLFLAIMAVVMISAIVGFIIGSLPAQEKYKLYYDNSVTYIERVK